MFKKMTAVVTSMVLAAPVFAADDFSGLTDGIDWSGVKSGILLIAAGLAAVYVVMKGVDLILLRLRK
jgi:hypothetical protein